MMLRMRDIGATARLVGVFVRFVRLGLVVSMIATMVACTEANQVGSGASRSTGTGYAEAPKGSSASVESTAGRCGGAGDGEAAGSEGILLRTCDTRIAAAPSDERVKSSVARALKVGVIRFLEISRSSTISARQLRPNRAGRLPALKYPTEVHAGAVGPVMLSVMPPDRRHSRLIYEPGASGRFTLADGAHTVVFEVCDDLDSTYNGGLVVEGPRCIGLRVIDVGRRDAAAEVRVPFGVKRCHG
ncbi:hypothetical protein BH24ACT15_BH24ACT15_38710 [soil metagenome]